MVGFVGGLAFTGVAGVVLFALSVLSVLLLQGGTGGCIWCAGVLLCCCCVCLDVVPGLLPDAVFLSGVEGGVRVVCLESASACFSCASSSACRTSSSSSTISIGVLSGCFGSVPESSGVKSEAVASGMGTGVGVGAGALGTSGAAVLSGGLRISSVPASHQMGCVMAGKF